LGAWECVPADNACGPRCKGATAARAGRADAVRLERWCI